MSRWCARWKITFQAVKRAVLLWRTGFLQHFSPGDGKGFPTHQRFFPSGWGPDSVFLFVRFVFQSKYFFICGTGGGWNFDMKHKSFTKPPSENASISTHAESIPGSKIIYYGWFWMWFQNFSLLITFWSGEAVILLLTNPHKYEEFPSRLWDWKLHVLKEIK